MDAPASMRVDRWLWAVRLLKTRSLATAACRAGHVSLGGERVKAARTVRVGDEVRVRQGGFDRIVTVTAIIATRASAAVAAECYLDLTPPPSAREEFAFAPVRERGAGRPTKRERRELERLRDRGANTEFSIDDRDISNPRHET